jgi:hypothetical protein
MERNQIVQVTNEKHHWYPALVVVDEVKSWGIQGYSHIPHQGQAYIRLKNEDIEVVGKAIIVTQKSED